MIPRLVTPSTGELIPCEEMKLWLKLDEDNADDDAVVRALVETAQRRWELYTRRSTLTQTYRLASDETPCGWVLELTPSPLVSITSIKGYTDTDGTDTGGTAMSSSDYFVDTNHEPGRVVLRSGASWPTGTRQMNAFIVEFTAGYSTASTGVPESAKTEIKNLVARAYEHRGDEVAVVKTIDELLRESDLALPEWG
jgi:uncharacterized phiE125 gp8 family phage protein